MPSSISNFHLYLCSHLGRKGRINPHFQHEISTSPIVGPHVDSFENVPGLHYLWCCVGCLIFILGEARAVPPCDLKFILQPFKIVTKTWIHSRFGQEPEPQLLMSLTTDHPIKTTLGCECRRCTPNSEAGDGLGCTKFLQPPCRGSLQTK